METVAALLGVIYRQDASGDFGLSSPLLPLTQRRKRNPETKREGFLAQQQVLSNPLHVQIFRNIQVGWIHLHLFRGRRRDSEIGRRAKFYSLTRKGRRHLDNERAQWERLSHGINLVLGEV